MPQVKLTKTRLFEGVWEGVLTGLPAEATPMIGVEHLGRRLDGVEVLQTPNGWGVRVPIPAGVISDGVQTFVVLDQNSGETLDSFALLAGDALADDIRAEVDLLRAELDMLKKAFRRHCVETM